MEENGHKTLLWLFWLFVQPDTHGFHIHDEAAPVTIEIQSIFCPNTRYKKQYWELRKWWAKRRPGYLSSGTPPSDDHRYLRMKSLRLQFATLFWPKSVWLMLSDTHETQLIELWWHPACSHFCFYWHLRALFLSMPEHDSMVWSPDLTSSLGNLSWSFWEQRQSYHL